MNNTTTLAEALAFHGHQCWASTAGVRLGLAAMEALGAPRSGAKQLHAIIEIGDHHGGMCFGDGIQFTTGCTFGKGNIEKTGEGKFAVTAHRQGLADEPCASPIGRRSSRASRPRRSCTKRAAGVPPTEIPEDEQMEVVNLVWDAPAADEIMTVGPIEPSAWSEPDEVVRFLVCPSCGELVAEPYARVAEGTIVCAACSGYPR